MEYPHLTLMECIWCTLQHTRIILVFYPTSSGIRALKKELSLFKTSKGTVQFSLTEPIPFDLVKEIVRFRVKENMSKNI
jgi:uncharacterized protein YdhG (YjbR/CyaY superfamily)